MNHWIRPTVDSRTGASHRRRGLPCQDASGRLGFHDADGTPVQVLVVSDGHGGARYVRSDIGSRLACAVALQEVERALAPVSVSRDGTPEDWTHWLASVLPERITTLWREEVRRHWQADADADRSRFTPLHYGATLGVLVLTPLWWGHTGLGDWDLVRIDANGDGALLSEEPPLGLRGEATYSLCLDRAERCFVARAAAQALPQGPEPFSLLLSTDGVRKSCSTDADFLTLCGYLVGLSQGEELAAALDHISVQGSGDDVSMAVGRWAPALTAAAWPEPGHSAPALIVQPPPAGPAAAPAAAPSALATPFGVTGGGDEGDGVQKPPLEGAGRRNPAAVSPAPSEGVGVSLGLWPLRSPGRLAGAGVLLVVGLAALATVPRLLSGTFGGRRAPAPIVLTAAQQRDLRLQVARLCAPDPEGARPEAAPAQAGVRPVILPPVPAAPSAAVPASPSGSSADRPKLAVTDAAAPGADRTAAGTASAVGSHPRAGATAIADLPAGDPRRRQRIAATLASRSSVFQRLATVEPHPNDRNQAERRQVELLLRQSPVDPLSALIALSATDPTLRPPSLPVERPSPVRAALERLAALLPAQQGLPAAAPSPLAALGSCLELRQVLQSTWRRYPAAGAVPAGDALRLPERRALPTTAVPPGASLPATPAPASAASPSPPRERPPAGPAPQASGGSP